MPVITVMYPSQGGSRFDENYYMQSHIPLVRQRWQSLGLNDVKILRGVPGPDGAAPTYTLLALLTFGSMDQFKDAAARHGEEIFADIPNFTDVKPVLQFNDPLG